MLKLALKVGLSPSKKNCFIYFNESPLKMMENGFYFILKALLVLKLFNFLSWFFGLVEKNGLIRKIRLISKFMTPLPGQQTFTIHILPTISQSKNEIWSGNRIYIKRIFFFKHHAENEPKKLLPDIFLFFKKALYEIKASGLDLSFNIFR